MNDSKKGFTLIEVIFSLLVISSCVLLITSSLYLIKKVNYKNYDVEDENSIHQIRFLYALGEQSTIEDDMLIFKFQNEDRQFYFKNNLLILEPGYQVFFRDLKSISFTKKDHCFYLQYHHVNSNENIERIIGCE